VTTLPVNPQPLGQLGKNKNEDAVEKSVELSRQFQELYGRIGTIYRAPGRVNLIGEHTDYNDGFVMPAAIDHGCWIAIAPRTDRKLLVYSTNFSQSVELNLNQSNPRPLRHWSDYVFGTAIMLERAGCPVSGADVLIDSDVPIGAGLSSSAALEVATAFALLDLSRAKIDRKALALTCQRAENEFVGARCGIMDQFIASHGIEGHCLRLDCRSLEYQAFRLPSKFRIVICNSMVKHAIASGEYNVRRSQCEEGVKLLSRVVPNITALRDVSMELFEQYSWLLPPLIHKRCHHVVSENERVLAFSDALERNETAALKRLMAESHSSLRDDYEVSCAELDLMVELAKEIPGTFGARMTGGGFGGCTVNLVAADAVQEFRDRVTGGYQRSTGKVPDIYEAVPSAGASGVEL
jgi:galactokinase